MQTKAQLNKLAAHLQEAGLGEVVRLLGVGLALSGVRLPVCPKAGAGGSHARHHQRYLQHQERQYKYMYWSPCNQCCGSGSVSFWAS